MMLWLQRKLHSFSFCSSFPFIIFFILFIPLALFTIVACRLGPYQSFSSISSYPFTWRSVSSHSSHIQKFINEEELKYDQRKTQPDSEFKQKIVLDEPNHQQSENEEEEKEAVLPQLMKRYSKMERLETILSKARSSIREAAQNNTMISTHEDADYVPRGPMYKNANAFHRSYLEMEKLFKIFVYKEGEPPVFHDGPCRSIYSTEGRFIHEMEKGNMYRTNDPDKALVYFLPFSVVYMVKYLYDPVVAHDRKPIGHTIADYIRLISAKHPFWNRSLGADHFMVSCHDWGPYSTAYVPDLFSNSIRVLCNANLSEGFNPLKDVSLPEIHLRTGEIAGLIGGPTPSQRSILAFFAGRLHGHIRYLLLEQWKYKDQDIRVYESLPEGVSYESMLKKSRFCLCPSGYEVASPRVVEAIYAECIPVLISDSYVAPFSDVLNWKAFSIEVAVEDIPNIKNILMRVSQTQYLRMHRRLKQVQRHFVMNGPPKRFDIFHMIMHSIWLRRLNIQIQEH